MKLVVAIALALLATLTAIDMADGMGAPATSCHSFGQGSC